MGEAFGRWWTAHEFEFRVLPAVWAGAILAGVVIIAVQAANRWWDRRQKRQKVEGFRRELLALRDKVRAEAAANGVELGPPGAQGNFHTLKNYASANAAMDQASRELQARINARLARRILDPDAADGCHVFRKPIEADLTDPERR